MNAVTFEMGELPPQTLRALLAAEPCGLTDCVLEIRHGFCSWYVFCVKCKRSMGVGATQQGAIDVWNCIRKIDKQYDFQRRRKPRDIPGLRLLEAKYETRD